MSGYEINYRALQRQIADNEEQTAALDFKKANASTVGGIVTSINALQTSKADVSAIPLPATGMPPAVSDTGAMGDIQRFALQNHTHASKARKARLQTAADGTITWTYPTPFAQGVIPIVNGFAEAPDTTDVINVQAIGTPTNTQVRVRVTRTQRSTVTLLGLTILSVPTSPGVIWVHLTAFEP